MYKRPWNNHLSFDHSQYINEVFSQSNIPAMDMKEECTNFVNANTACDTNHSVFTIREVTLQPNNTFIESAFDDVNVKDEPISTNTDEEDPLDNLCEQYSLPTNALIKEEVIIECEPDADILETNNGNTETSNTTANQDKRKFPKRRRKVHKNWQKDTVFTLEMDALNVIKNELIWTKYSTNRTEEYTKVIYRCRNVKSKGQQCDAGVYLQYSHTDPYVTLFRSNNRHTCESIESKRKRPFKLDGSIHRKVESNNDPVQTDENEPASKRSKKPLINCRSMESKSCDIPDGMAVAPNQIAIMKDIEDNIHDPVEESDTVTWNRKFNRKEDIDLAAIYDLDLKIILRKYETSPILTPADQMTICKSIVKCYLYDDHDRKFGTKDFKRISTVIAQRFPSEVPEAYYTKTKKTRARGKLYDQFQHFRGLLISVGLATKRRKNPGSSRETGRDSDEESGSETNADDK